MKSGKPLADILTPRELQVVELLTVGHINKEIAAMLGVSEHTVKNYFWRIFDKVGCDNRVVLAVRYVREQESPK